MVLNEENEFRASAERRLFSSGDDVLLDLVAGNDVPSVRRTLSAPSGSSLSLPPPVEEPSVLELKRDYALGLVWTPGESGPCGVASLGPRRDRLRVGARRRRGARRLELHRRAAVVGRH